MAQQAYDELIRRNKEVTLLGSCSALLGWEEQTYMPAGGVEHRGNQLALLAGMAHDKMTAPRIGELLAEVEGSSLVSDPLSEPAVNAREIRRHYDRATKLPKALVEELARVTTVAQRQWIEARKKSDFAAFQPWLEQIFSLKRQEAEAIGYAGVPYDALLDEYEPGALSADITHVFAQLREELVPLVGAIINSSRQPDTGILQRDYPEDRQRVFAEAAAGAIGFDFHQGRLDPTAHPFCSRIGPGDCRITTRYNRNQFNEAFFGVLHEVGHGLYEQGLSAECYGSPMGEAISLGVHESQSRLWENAVGRSRAFWQYFYPMAQSVFREALREVSLDDFHFAINNVQPSLNRVSADEATYNLHILVRFELEQALLADDLRVGDIPDAWNDKYQKYLSVTPPDDASGCLQDIHWSAGLIGYFPTYTLGNLYAAQIMNTAREELGDLDEMFSRGQFMPLREWLRAKIHRQGHRYRSPQLVEKITGSPPSHMPLVNSLHAKFGALYGFA